MTATFHHDFLEGAEHRAHFSGLGFREQVEERLQFGEREYGDSYRTKSTAKMLREIREECFDVAAWSSLLAETLPERGMSDEKLANARLLLQELAALGVMGDQVVNALVDLTG